MSHSAIEPTIRNMWLELHERHVREITALKEVPRVVFAGDSLIDWWRHQDSWKSKLGKYSPLNLGIGGDRTQHLLWRLQHLQLPKAELYSVLIGTNNIQKNSTGEILEGIEACCREILRQCPGSRILLNKLLPRQKHQSDPAYQQVCEVNGLIPRLIDGKAVIDADFSHVFQVDGSGEEHLNYERIMEDHVHISSAGYDYWADALLPVVDSVLQA